MPMNLLLAVLVVLNVVLFAAWQGAFGDVSGDAREPSRLARQVQPEQLRIVPLDRPPETVADAGDAKRSASPGADGTAAAGADVQAGTGEGEQGAATPSVPAGGAGVGTSPAPAAAAPPPITAPAAASVPAPAATASPAAAPVNAAPPGPSAQPSGPAACIEWGPFSQAEMSRALATAQSAGVRAADAVRREGPPTAWMVHVPPAGSTEAAQQRLAALRQQGVTDAYVLPDGPLRTGISLGVFRNEEGARTLQRQLEAKGVVDARIAPRGPERWALRLRSDTPLPASTRATLAARHGAADWRDCNLQQAAR